MPRDTIHWLLGILKPEDVVAAVRLGAGVVFLGVTNVWTHWRTARSAKTVARALAAGYYYNFLERIQTHLVAGSLSVGSSSGAGPSLGPFSTVKVVVMTPRLLSDKALQAAGTARGGNKGAILTPVGQRDMAISYEVQGVAPSQTLIIKDAPGTYSALKRYMEDKLKLRSSSHWWSKWRQTEKVVLREYRETVEDFCKKGSGVTFTLDWMPCG